MSANLSFRVELTEDYDAAVEKVTAALKEEGFGVLTEINVKEVLKTKIDVEFRRYVILGACNPPLAHKALSSEPLVGMLLPCNVTVEETENGSLVNLVNPRAMLTGFEALAENENVVAVAEDATARIERVAKALRA